MTMGLALLCFGCLTTAPLSAAETVTIVQASGQTITDANLREWNRDRIGIDKDSPRELPIDEILSLHFARSATVMAGGDPLVLLVNGDRLVLRPVGVFDDVLTATWHRTPTRPALKLPLETVSAIIFDLPAAMNDRQRLFADLQTLPPGNDVVLLANGDRLQGDFERLDANVVHLKTPAGLLKADRNRVRAIRMNPDLTNSPRISGRRMALSFIDGSHVTAQKVELVGRELKFTMFSKLDLALPSASIVSCQIYGIHAIPLSDRDPHQVQFVPFLSAQWSLVKNANALRGPLTIRGVEFGTGLGMHSRMLVTYALNGAEREFRATVGIDDCANGGGSARFALELDGRRVWESLELTGRSPAIAVPPLKLDGAKQLTLVVDYGKNADVLDYADWCDAVFVLNTDR